MIKKALIFAAMISALSIVILQFNQQNSPSQLQSQYQLQKIPSHPAQLQYRRFIFQQNFKEVKNHNSDPTQNYKKGLNQFSIYTKEEFKQIFLSEMILPEFSQLTEVQEPTLSLPTPNIDIDWTTKGAVSRVKYQGLCASAWAFSATGAAQSWALIHKRNIYLSQQQLVDCSSAYGNQGCKGGYPESALKYIRDNGLTTEESYPYYAITQTCHKKGGDFKISLIQKFSGCPGLLTAIATQPVSITVDASNWNDYASGVFDKCHQNINHAALLVGVANGVWKVKNEWGTSWGEKGFIRLAPGDTCGICINGGVFPQ